MTTRQLVGNIATARSKLASWQFGQLLVFFCLLLFLLPLLHHGVLVKTIAALFVLNSLLVADSNNPNAPALRFLGWFLWGLAAVSNVVEELHLNDALTFATKCFAITTHTLLYLLCAASILSVVFRARRITLDLILASVVAYQLIGLFFAQIYTLAIVDQSEQPASARQRAAKHRELSGGNDLLQFRDAGDARLRRHAAGHEHSPAALRSSRPIVGQFYVAVIVAVLVSAFVSQRMQDQTGAPNDSE